MKFFKRIFREGSTSLIFVFGLAISCFILINIAQLVETVQKENHTLHSYPYTVSGILDAYTLFQQYHQAEINEFEDLQSQLVDGITLRLMSEKNGNISISTMVSVNKKIDKYPAEIIMATNEPLQIECESDYDYTQKNGIIIGESLLKNVIEKDGVQILTIDNVEMQIIGVRKNNMSAGVDNSIHIFWSNCTENIRNILRVSLKNDISSDLKYTYKSQSDLSEQYKAFVLDMKKLGIENTIYEADYEGDYQNYWHTFYNSIFMSIGLLFSIFNCFSVSCLWLNRRKPELAIRKAYGYSIWQIAGVLLRDILLLNIPAGVAACLLQLVNSVVFGDYMMGEMLMQKIFIVCMGMMGVTTLILIFMIRHVQKVSPVSILAEN